MKKLCIYTYQNTLKKLCVCVCVYIYRERERERERDFNCEEIRFLINLGIIREIELLG